MAASSASLMDMTHDDVLWLMLWAVAFFMALLFVPIRLCNRIAVRLLHRLWIACVFHLLFSVYHLVMVLVEMWPMLMSYFLADRRRAGSPSNVVGQFPTDKASKALSSTFMFYSANVALILTLLRFYFILAYRERLEDDQRALAIRLRDMQAGKIPQPEVTIGDIIERVAASELPEHAEESQLLMEQVRAEARSLRQKDRQREMQKKQATDQQNGNGKAAAAAPQPKAKAMPAAMRLAGKKPNANAAQANARQRRREREHQAKAEQKHSPEAQPTSHSTTKDKTE